LMALGLPRSQPSSEIRYSELIGSLGGLWREFAPLRRATFSQALLFAVFNAFWTTLALHLQQPPWRLGAEVAGLFGVVGMVGIFAAPIAGRIADKHGPHRVIALGALLALAAWIIFGLWASLIGLGVGVIVLDFAVQSSLVSNQHIVYALRPEARSRLNTLFFGGMFIGGACGSAAATIAWKLGGWTALSALGAALCLTATLVQISNLRSRH
jgi:predicted MFS family arabinose efflux permease